MLRRGTAAETWCEVGTQKTFESITGKYYQWEQEGMEVSIFQTKFPHSSTIVI